MKLAIESRSMRRWALILSLVVLASGTAFASWVFTPGMVTPTDVSPGAPQFASRIYINTMPAPGMPPPTVGGFGDQIISVELGRDDRGPSTMPELRRDPIVVRWVIISVERGNRPSDFASVEPAAKNGFCPFCPGNEEKTPPEVYAARPNGGQ